MFPALVRQFVVVVWFLCFVRRIRSFGVFRFGRPLRVVDSCLALGSLLNLFRWWHSFVGFGCFVCFVRSSASCVIGPQEVTRVDCVVPRCLRGSFIKSR